MRLAAVLLCLVVVQPVLAQGKKSKGKERPAPVVEIDPWGRPQHTVGGEELLVWQDESGWHIRAYAGGKRSAKFSGTVHVVDGKVKKLWGTQGLEAKGKAKADFGIVSKDEKSITFKLSMVKGGEDGFEFSLTPTAKQLEITMLVDGFDHPEKIRV